MRLLYHAPGLAAFRPAMQMPHLLGVQPSVTNSLEGLRASHKLTGNRGNIIHAEAPAKIFAKTAQYSAYGNLATLRETLGAAFADDIASKFDIIVVSMANFIHPKHDGTRLFKALKALDGKIPFVVLGCGLQGTSKLSDFVPGNRDLLAILNERAAVFGVRGEKTKQWLTENGFNNATVLGCPSLYAYPYDIMSVDGAAVRAKGRAVNVMTAGHLSMHQGKIIRRGSNLVAALDGVKASYVFQDEFLHYDESIRMQKLYREGSSSVDEKVVNDWLTQQCGRPVNFEKYYYFNEASAWRQAALKHDVFIGDRFHGGVAALQAGLPVIFLKHDNRVSELTAHFNLPNLTIAEFRKKGLERTLDELLSDERLNRMKAVYRKRYKEFCAAMAPHGLAPAIDFLSDMKSTASDHEPSVASGLQSSKAPNRTGSRSGQSYIRRKLGQISRRFS